MAAHEVHKAESQFFPMIFRKIRNKAEKSQQAGPLNAMYT